MKATVIHETFGEITYEESFWTSKKNIWINKNLLVKKEKNTYIWKKDQQEIIVRTSGNFVMGATVSIGTENIKIVPAPKFIEIVCSLLIFAVLIAWGNSQTLCSFVPMVGGAIGGAIAGVGTFLSFILMKKTKKVWAKLLIWLGVFSVTFLANFSTALIFISLLMV